MACLQDRIYDCSGYSDVLPACWKHLHIEVQEQFADRHRFLVPAQVSKQWKGSRDLTANSSRVVTSLTAFPFGDHMSAAVSHLQWHNVIAYYVVTCLSLGLLTVHLFVLGSREFGCMSGLLSTGALGEDCRFPVSLAGTAGRKNPSVNLPSHLV